MSIQGALSVPAGRERLTGVKQTDSDQGKKRRKARKGNAEREKKN